MKSILNISRTIDIGSRFNNFSLRNEFPRFDWESHFASWEKPANEAVNGQVVIHSAKNKINSAITRWQRKASRLTGNVDGYYRNAKYFMEMEVFKKADLLHFHVVHEDFLSLHDWIKLTREKPVVWTWHDPYPMHGHCIHSFDCERYQTGCKSCPNLDYYFEIKRDRSFENLAERIAAIEKIDPLVIVASEWMHDRILKSQFKKNLRVEVVPFGVKAPTIGDQARDTLKATLNIPKDNIVVGLRADVSSYKGLDLIKQTIEKFSKEYPYCPITFITCHMVEQLSDYAQLYQVIDLGWVGGDEIHQYYSIMDFFLMPSRAESFGMMAVEAMMNGTHPLVTYGTALESITANGGDALISPHSPEDYYKLFVKAVLNVGYYRDRRHILSSQAQEKYSSEVFISRLSNLYSQEYARFHNF